MKKKWRSILLFGAVILGMVLLITESYRDRGNNSAAVSDAKGDGVADDTQAIQQAIDETPEGGTLQIDEGIYKLSKNEELVSVTGYGEAFFALEITKPITILMDGAVFKTETDKEYGVFWIHDTEEVHLIGGVLLGEKIPESGSLISNIAVMIQDTQKSSVDSLYMKNHSQGVHLHHSDNNTVRNVTSEFNFGSGIINFASNNNVIESCTIRNSGDGHLSLYGVGKGNLVKNCFVSEDRPGNDSQQGITVESELSSIIENNTVTGFYYGIDIKNASDSNIIRSNNVFNNYYNIAVRPGDGGGNLMTPSNNIQIINNLALDPRNESDRGIFIGIGEGHVVTGNVLYEEHLVITDEDLMEQYDDENFYIDHGNDE
ncbi:right-handed parallel beta-helix repeat-containing protein [Metaplanococcus flavidus]|uniref:Right-handed parallel beta-helix repeat-containing protein n=1 Tax=Metaplanococcus flavidus TaxID=569883 RepID=A0ABW3L9V0_9BACL